MIRNQCAGFFLVELVIVLGILSIIFLYACRLDFLHAMYVRTQTELLCGICRTLQQQAMITNKQMAIHFDCNKHTYTYGGVTYYLPAQVRFGIQEGVKGPPSAPVHSVQAPVTFTHAQLICHPTGILDAGTLYLIDTTQNYQYALSVAVSQASYIRLYRYEHGTWKLIN